MYKLDKRKILRKRLGHLLLKRSSWRVVLPIFPIGQSEIVWSTSISSQQKRVIVKGRLKKGGKVWEH